MHNKTVVAYLTKGKRHVSKHNGNLQNTDIKKNAAIFSKPQQYARCVSSTKRECCHGDDHLYLLLELNKIFKSFWGVNSAAMKTNTKMMQSNHHLG